MADPYGSATSQVDESRRKLLEAVATAGTAGKKAYEDAQAGINTQQQEALARAQQQASLGGVTEAGLAELQSKLGNTYGQRQSALASQQAGFEGALNQTAASGQSYLDKLSASLPALQEENRLKLADKENQIKQAIELAKQKAEAEQAQWEARFKLQQEALDRRQQAGFAHSDAQRQATENAKFPLDQIKGATILQQQTNQQNAQQAAKDLAGLQGKSQASVEYDKNATQIGSLNRQIKEYTGRLKELQSISGAGKQVKQVQNHLKDLGAQLSTLQNRNKQLDAEIVKRANELPGQIAEAQKKAQTTLAEAQKSPTQLSREIAIQQFGRDPLEAVGKLSETTWQPLLNAIASGDQKMTNAAAGEQAVGLAKKLNIKGGAPIVKQILDKPEIQSWIQQASALAGGDYTLKEIENDLKTDFFDKGQDRTYAVLREILRTLPWGKEQR